MLIKLKIIPALNESLDVAVTNGRGLSIKGSVKQKNLPTPCRVRLFEKISGRILADIQTDKHGNYEFKNLARVAFFILAHHPTSQFNAVIQDNVVPK